MCIEILSKMIKICNSIHESLGERCNSDLQSLPFISIVSMSEFPSKPLIISGQCNALFETPSILLKGTCHEHSKPVFKLFAKIYVLFSVSKGQGRIWELLILMNLLETLFNWN